MRHPFAFVAAFALFACASDRTSGPVETSTTTTEAAAIVATLRAVPDIAPQMKPRAIAVDGAFSSGALVARIPDRASQALRLSGSSSDTWIEVAPRGAIDVRGRDADGARVYAGAMASTDLVYVQRDFDVEELRLTRTHEAASRATYDLKLGPALVSMHVVDGHVEVLDAEGRARFRTTRAFAVDANGVRRDVVPSVHGTTLEMTLDTSGLALPIAIDPAWTSAGALSGTRLNMAAVKLGSGKVLVIGGTVAGGSTPVSTVELYDPATNTWTTKASLGTARGEHTATTFDTGKRVLVIGGYGTTNLSTAEIYDSTTDTWTTKALPATVPNGGSFPTAMRRSHTAILGKDGKVYVFAGKNDSSFFYDSILAFTSGSDTFSVLTAKFDEPTKDVVPLLLSDGKVLLTGGGSRDSGGKERMSRSVNVFDPAAGTMTRKSDMPVPRTNHGAVQLTAGVSSGKVLVFAGAIPTPDESGLVPSQGGAIYDLSTDTWSPAPFLSTKRFVFQWAPLPSGRILAAGGASEFGSTTLTASSTAEVFDPVANAWLPAGTMSSSRGAGIAAALDDGSVLVAGGVKSAFEGFLTATSSAERFALVAKGKACTDAGECATGACADKICCDTACTDNCAACDIVGKEGTCSPVAGAPHGTRPACTGGTGECAATCDGTDTKKCNFPSTTATCGTNACKAGVETHASTCDGAGACKDVPKACGDLVCGPSACLITCATKADCVNTSHFCEAGKCIPQQANGSACTRDEACAGGICVDGVCCESKCEGQCQACDVPGQAGKCVPVKGKPHGKRTDCEKNASDSCASKACDGSNTTSCAATVGPCSGYACDDVAKECKKVCLADPDCGTGYQCEFGKCVPKSSKCSGDGASMIGADGKETSCAPLVCRDRVCITKCVTSGDCVGGYACDATGTCVPAGGAADTGSSGGCSVTDRGDAQEHAALVPLAVVALGLLRRRRAGSRRARH